MKPLVRLTRDGALIQASKKELNHLRAEFDHRHCVRLRGFVEPSLLGTVRVLVGQGRFYERRDGRIARESCLRQGAAYNLMQFAANDPALLDFMKELTGCPDLIGFDGRIYRFLPQTAHYDSWHDDMKKGHIRRYGLSVNLSERVYRGGALQLRDKRSKKIHANVRNTGFGDAMIFRIDPKLQHRVMPLTGREGRTAFAGWFMTRRSGYAWAVRSAPQGPPRDPKQTPVRIQAHDWTVSRPDSNTARVVLNPKTRRFYALGPVGDRLWPLAARGVPLPRLVSILCAEYEVTRQRAENDVKRLLADVCRKDLAVPVL